MSAFIVDKTHIDLLVEVALHGPSDAESLWDPISWRRGEGDEIEFVTMSAAESDWLGATLAGANVDSVCTRYEDASGLLPDWVLHGYRFATPRVRPTCVEALKAINCYVYQAGEHDDWPTSEAANFCEQLRAQIVRSLPGYDAAAWEWNGDMIGAHGGRTAPPVAQGELVEIMYKGVWRQIRPLGMRQTRNGRVLIAQELRRDGVTHPAPVMKSFNPGRIESTSRPIALLAA